MITNPSAKTILCFGDSNTHGAKPDRSGRFGLGVRWTSHLQDLLGRDYYVIEEGLGGRTTNLAHPQSEKPNRNGIEYFKPSFESHLAVEYLVIMLGTNDWKIDYNRSASETGEAIKQYVKFARTISQELSGKQPKIILISPVRINTKAEQFNNYYTGVYDESSVQKAEDMVQVLKIISNELGCTFLDAGKMAKVGIDGLHIDESSQKSFAEILAKTIEALD